MMIRHRTGRVQRRQAVQQPATTKTVETHVQAAVATTPTAAPVRRRTSLHTALERMAFAGEQSVVASNSLTTNVGELKDVFDGVEGITKRVDRQAEVIDELRRRVYALENARLRWPMYVLANVVIPVTFNFDVTTIWGQIFVDDLGIQDVGALSKIKSVRPFHNKLETVMKTKSPGIPTPTEDECAELIQFAQQLVSGKAP